MEGLAILGRRYINCYQKSGGGSFAAVWDREDHLLGAERQLKDENIDRTVNSSEKLIEDLTECSNKMF